MSKKGLAPALERKGSTALEYLCDGTSVWYSTERDSWKPGIVVKHEGSKVQVRDIDDAGDAGDVLEISTSLIKMKEGDAHPTHVDDMVQLPDLIEPAILHNIRQRYLADIIYTYVGPVLISVNPYIEIDGLYDDGLRSDYTGTKKLAEKKPHLFGVTACAYSQLVRSQKSQSLLISGESGAGKTECTRHVLNYLGQTAGSVDESNLLGKRLMMASPVLEAFGNAKTVANNNSSRFGKFFQVYFDVRGDIAGATIRDYLLEKSRVVQQAVGERSYHALYMLLSGATSDMRAQLKLRESASEYAYLRPSQCFEIKGRDDAAMFKEMCESMSAIGLSNDEQQHTFRCLSAVLLCGEIEMGNKEGTAAACVSEMSKSALVDLSMLLGVKAPHLETVLTQRSLSARASSMYTVPLKPVEAQALRDALAKLLYAKLFQWLVQRMNELLSVDQAMVHNATQLSFIGVLDIFGFEDMKHNSFEQFCINYANERLQQLFNRNLFVVEQEIYRAEGIRWDDVEFSSNDACVRLIDKRPMGMFAILDEECCFPNGSDSSFLNKIVQLNENDTHFDKPRTSQTNFVIHHYAQPVSYDTTGFLDKNRDSVSEALLELLKSSTEPFVSGLCKGATAAVKSVNNEASNARARGRGGRRPGARKSMMPGGSVQKTLGGQFKEQLDSLAATLSSTEMHFVRCIKPNDAKRDHDFRGPSCLRQLRCAGVLDTIRIRSQGYAVRPMYEQFVARYACLVNGTAPPNAQESLRAHTEWLVDRLFVPKNAFQLGNTRIFLKESAHETLQEKRTQRMAQAALVLARHRSAQLCRRRFVAQKKAALSMQCAYRALCARRDVARLRKEQQKKQREAQLRVEKERLAREEQAKQEKLEQERKEREQQKLAAKQAAQRTKEKHAANTRVKNPTRVSMLSQIRSASGPAGTKGNPGPRSDDDTPDVPDVPDIPDVLDVPDFGAPPIPVPEAAPPTPDANEADEWRTISVGARGEHKIKTLRGEKKSLLSRVTATRPRQDSLADYKPTNVGGFAVDGGGGDEEESDDAGIDMGAISFNWGNDDDGEEGDKNDEGADDEDFPAPPPAPPPPAMKKNPSIRPTGAVHKSEIDRSDIKANLENLIAIPPPPGHGMTGGDDASASDSPPKPSYNMGESTFDIAPPVNAMTLSDQPQDAMNLLGEIMGGGGGAAAPKESAEDRLVAKMALASKAEDKRRALLKEEVKKKRHSLAELRALTGSAPDGTVLHDPVIDKAEAAAAVDEGAILSDIMGGGGDGSNDDDEAPPPVPPPPGDDTMKFAAKNPLFPDAKPKAKLSRAQMRQTAAPGAYDVSGDNTPTLKPRAMSGMYNESPVLPERSYFGDSEFDDAPKRKVIRGADLIEPIDGVALGYCKDPKCFRLNMSDIIKPSALKIPEANAFTKFDYTENRAHPFSFSDKADPVHLVEPEPFPIPEDIENPTIDEPKSGLTPSDAPMKNIEKAIKNAKFQEYVPKDVFPRKAPLKKMSDISSKYKVHGLLDLNDAHKDRVRVLNISDTSITKDQLKRLPKLFAELTSLEYLICSGCGLQKFPVDTQATLRYVDLRHNKITDVDNLCKVLAKCPCIEVLKLDGNDCLRKKDALNKIIAALPRIRRLNSDGVGRVERFNALVKHGTSQQRKHIEQVRWDVCMCFAPELTAMDKWDAAKLTRLCIEGAHLTEIHVGMMTNLRELRLADNDIGSIVGSGIERLDKLHTLDLRRNAITKLPMVAPVAVLPRLRSLDLRENKDGKHEFKDYRLLLIFHTRHLKGTNRHNGLAELDSEPVTMEERVQAVEVYAKKKKNIEETAWRVYLMDYVGHKQLRDPEFCRGIRELSLPESRLRQVNLTGMRALEFLDLSNNLLRTVQGLEETQRLRFLNLSGNAKLDLKSVLGCLEKHHARLEQLSLCVVAPGESANIAGDGVQMRRDSISGSGIQRQNSLSGTLRSSQRKDSSGTLKRSASKSKNTNRHPDNAVYRLQVLRATLLQNRKLNFVDNKYITLSERITSIAYLTDKKRQDEVELYKFQAGLASNCVMPIMRRLHPADVKKGAAYDAKLITSLRRMGSLGLKSPFCDFSMFFKLEELNIADNSLTSLLDIGLKQLKFMRVLDMHNNKLKHSLDDLAAFLDEFHHLECVSLRGNPCMQSSSYKECRFQLMGKMQNLRKVKCQLRVLDTEISIRERVQAWRKEGGDEEETEQMRLKAVMFLRMEPNKLPSEIKSLDLSNSGFPRIDMSKFSSLCVLLMRGNALTSTRDSALETLSKLKVLDLRENKLDAVEDAAWLIKKLPRVETIGLAGNPWSEKKWRHALLCLLPELHERECSLKMIDESDIQADEVINAWLQNKPSKAEAKNARFRVLMLTKLPLGSKPEHITELDLSQCDLDSVDLGGLKAMRKLSLANNNIKSLKDSQLHQLQLRALDVSHNKLQSMSDFAVLLRAMPKLNVLLMYRNPCYDKDEPKTRLKWLASMGQYFTPLTNPLRILCGEEVSIAELCDSAESDKRFDKHQIEEFRLKLVLQKRTLQGKSRAAYETLSDSTRVVVELDISGCGFKSLHGLQRLPHRLRKLDASKNLLTKMELGVWEGLGELEELDLRDNKLSSLKDILTMLKDHVPKLVMVNLEGATKNAKETAGHKDYNMKVMKVLRQLHSCDGMKNPFGYAALTIGNKSMSNLRAAHRTIEIKPSMFNKDDSPVKMAPLASVTEDDDLPEVTISGGLGYSGRYGAMYNSDDDNDDNGDLGAYLNIPAPLELNE